MKKQTAILPDGRLIVYYSFPRNTEARKPTETQKKSERKRIV